jgi:hypothetical protein
MSQWNADHKHYQGFVRFTDAQEFADIKHQLGVGVPFDCPGRPAGNGPGSGEGCPYGLKAVDVDQNTRKCFCHPCNVDLGKFRGYGVGA